MLKIKLEPQLELEWRGENPAPNLFKDYPPLLHQWKTYQADKPLIVNTYNTGTGKTRAALLRLLRRAQDKNFELSYAEDNALLIAPTNELLAQHAKDAQEFCQKTGLPYQVIAISRERLNEYRKQAGFSEADLRNGAVLHQVLNNPASIEPNWNSNYKAAIFVVNPDIFYYAFYFGYAKFDRLPLFRDALEKFNYIIIDEFHYYTPKQFASFLFFIQLSKRDGYIKSQSTRRQFCLLTATPSDKVRQYLERLGLEIEWIEPKALSSEEREHTSETRALAAVELEVYNSEDLAEGLITLVGQQQTQLKHWLDGGEEGAIISGALWRINQIYDSLKGILGESRMGRLTGAETRSGRAVAKGKALILATPTVDIGYNFDRDKARQNIDFLLLDARSSDEFVQRLGRAGRVLGKKERDRVSQVRAIISPEFYAALKSFDGQSLSRVALRELAEANMPARNLLYGYIQSGAIAEAFKPIYQYSKLVATSEKDDIEALFTEVQQLFAADSRFTYSSLQRSLNKFSRADDFYKAIETFPADQEECLNKCKERLMAEQTYRKSKGIKLWSNQQEAFEWLEKDLRCYFTEKARYSFREAFQPPPALVGDPKNLLSSDPIALYDALHIAKNYKAQYFEAVKEWEDKLKLTAPEAAKEAVVCCNLLELRKPGERLQISLQLEAGASSKSDWETLFAYRMTALYGIKVVAENGNLNNRMQNIFKERYIPVLVAEEGSYSHSKLRGLAKQGQVYPYALRVNFNDKVGNYVVVLGTLALQVWAEPSLKGCLTRDSRKVREQEVENNPDCLIF